MKALTTPSAVDGPNPSRMTDFYDDYLRAYTSEPPPPMPRGVARRNTSRRNQEDEDEEGYASGEDFDGPSRSKLNTIRIRVSSVFSIQKLN